MAINLLKKPEGWVITYIADNKILHETCNTIEIAAEFMEKLEIKDEEIDLALCEMAAYEHDSAFFTQGNYSHSQES